MADENERPQENQMISDLTDRLNEIWRSPTKSLANWINQIRAEFASAANYQLYRYEDNDAHISAWEEHIRFCQRWAVFTNQWIIVAACMSPLGDSLLQSGFKP